MSTQLTTLRLTLNLGGDDITEVFYVLLQQSCFPYKEMDLARLYDWNLMQDLKHQYCTFIIVSLSVQYISMFGAQYYRIYPAQGLMICMYAGPA
jgi:actin-related protein